MWIPVGLSVLLATALKPTAPAAETVHRSGDNVACDVAIIGSGFAGLAAAVEASKVLPSSSKILVIEKMHKAGGNSVMNAGQIAAVGSDAQRLAGVEDSVELMIKGMIKAGVDSNHPNLLQTMIEDSNDVVKWTEKELGVKYRNRVTQMGGHSVPHTRSTINAPGNDTIRPMLRVVKSLPNVELLLGTSMKSFILSPDKREVRGIRVT